MRQVVSASLFALACALAQPAAERSRTACNDYEIVAANLLDGEERGVRARVPAYALYIDPPLGRVGITEAEARGRGRPILIGRRPMSKVSRAVEKAETLGFMKVAVDAASKRILGAAILGTGGDKAIHGVLDIVNGDVPYEVLQRAVPIHPTRLSSFQRCSLK